MSDTFNPTKENLHTIESLILDIKQKRNDYINRKVSLQNSLSQLRDKYREVEQGSKDYHRIKNTRQNVKNHLNNLELKIKGLNDELLFKNKLRLEIEFHLKHNKRLEGKEDLDRVINKITAMRTKYNEFAKDRTRISSLRVLALEFVSDLEALLKKP